MNFISFFYPEYAYCDNQRQNFLSAYMLLSCKAYSFCLTNWDLIYRHYDVKSNTIFTLRKCTFKSSHFGFIRAVLVAFWQIICHEMGLGFCHVDAHKNLDEGNENYINVNAFILYLFLNTDLGVPNYILIYKITYFVIKNIIMFI